MRSARKGPSFLLMALTAAGILGGVTHTTANDCDGRSAEACETCQFLDGFGEALAEGGTCPAPGDNGCSGWRRVEVVSGLFCCGPVLSGYVGLNKCRQEVIVIVYPPYGNTHPHFVRSTCLRYSVCEWDNTGNGCTDGPIQRMTQQRMKTYYCEQS